MQQLLTLHVSDFDPSQIDATDRSQFHHRHAARAVVFDEHNAVGLLHVSKEGYFKLAGGGVDDGEDIQAALHREVFEELGCSIEVTGELGEILEYRDYWQLIQTSYCFTARVIGKKGQLAFTEKEASQGFTVSWQKDLATAIKTITVQQPFGNDHPLNYAFMQRRELAILEAAKRQISNGLV